MKPCDDFVDQLHDATLMTVVIDWREGRVTLNLRLSVPRRTLGAIVCQFTGLTFSRKEEWGPSVSILEGEHETVADGSKVLTIELQSGDVLRIECEAVSFFEEPLS